MDNIVSPIQQLYYAWDLSHKKSVSDDSKFTGVLSEAKVDMNPHQVDAALFAFNSPLSKGAILADEVGLGKTIEAGIILSELWAEHKRKIIIVVPASLRTQWNIELLEKFHLPSTILEGNSYKKSQKEGVNLLKEENKIIICSYNFVTTNKRDVEAIRWDLVVIDEAHKLRNVYKTGNKIGSAIRDIFKPYKKILLTATPLQNNLKELYGLISIIDPNFFLSIDTFDKQYNKVSTRSNSRFGELKGRLSHIIHRTLRSQVKEYVNYTKRSAFVQQYTPTAKEQELYAAVEEYLQAECCYSFSPKARPMLSLMIRKILSSSAYAIGFTLQGFIRRLESHKETGTFVDFADITFEGIEINQDEEVIQSLSKGDYQEITQSGINDEISLLRRCVQLTSEIETESKAKHLLVALKQVFENNKKINAPRKALIFTESTRTQTYLKKMLHENGYENKVVCFNGSNNEDHAKDIYRRWLQQNAGSKKISGAKAVDMKQALVDYFKDEGEIMIATESGAEGINLQFCSVIVNYDMPWNPQRIEQRIGRCHRYGQKYDVVVVNFVNNQNYADTRVYELLNDKFNLFEGVFGSSDEVLGSLESGIDFEHKINSIFNECRTEREIVAAFDQLQLELEEMIKQRITETKKSLLENFDEEVVNKLKTRKLKDKDRVSQYNKHFWLLAKSVLRDSISEIDDDKMSFVLKKSFGLDIPIGSYILNNNQYDYHQLRVNHPLGEYILLEALSIKPGDCSLTFTLENNPSRVMLLEQHKGDSGVAVVYRVKINNKYDSQEQLLFSAVTNQGQMLPADFVKKLLDAPCVDHASWHDDALFDHILRNDFDEQLNKLKIDIDNQTNEFANYEIDKYHAWSEDQLFNLNTEVIEQRRELDALKRQARKESDARQRLAMVEEEKKLMKSWRQKQAKLFALEDECEEKLDQMVEVLRSSMKNKIESSIMFKFRWEICS